MQDKVWKKITFLFSILTFFFPIMMAYVIFDESKRAFQTIGIKLFAPKAGWRPLGSQPAFGVLPFLTGTFYVSFLSLLPALVFGVGCSLFLSFYISKKSKNRILGFIDILAGVPSVIFGFIGLVVLVKLFENAFSLSSGECVLSASILLSIMLLPFIVSNCCETVEKIKDEYMASALSLGVSKEYFIKKIAFSQMKRSIISSGFIAFGRAMGETMAVMMVLGNSPVYPKLFGRAETVAALTALEMGSAEFKSLHFSAIYAANAILLVILIAVYGVGILIKRRGNENEK